MGAKGSMALRKGMKRRELGVENVGGQSGARSSTWSWGVERKTKGMKEHRHKWEDKNRRG